MNIVTTWMCSIMLLCQFTFAQNTPVAEKFSGRKVWLVSTSIPKDLENPLPILIGEELMEARLYLRSIGSPIPLDSTGIVRGVKVIKDDDGKAAYQNLFVSKVPEGVSQALIILVPQAEDADGLRFKSKVIDLSKFKKGGYLYVNLVPTKIGVTLGDLKTVIAPGKMEFINPLGNKDKDVKHVQFFYNSPKGDKGEWKLMTSGKMAIYKSRREICVFFYNEQIENVDFRGIPFMIPEPRPQPKKP